MDGWDLTLSCLLSTLPQCLSTEIIFLDNLLPNHKPMFDHTHLLNITTASYLFMNEFIHIFTKKVIISYTTY